MMKIAKNNFLLVLILFINISVFSQENEQYSGVIKNGPTKGFKSIPLTPNLRAVANVDLSDLRILDSLHRQTAYFLQENGYKVTEKFVPLKNKITFGKKRTQIIIINSTKKLFEHFTLKVTNADARKNCTIEGSNDNNKWYVVSEKKQLTLQNTRDQSFNYYDINFPNNDYKYIKIVIDDSSSAPINVKDVGYFVRKVTRQETRFNPLNIEYEISQKDRSTMIHIHSDRVYEINRMTYSVSAPELYKRSVSIYTIKKDGSEEMNDLMGHFTLSSDTENIQNNISYKHNDFWIEISNEDNQPLTIDSIEFYQKAIYVVTDLKPNQDYTVTAGDKNLKKPSYDLINFKHKIDTDLSLINIENERLYYNPPPEIIRDKEVKSFYEQPWFMWLCIGVVALIILAFTLSLMKKTEEKG